MTAPGGGSSATDEARREWLEHLDAAAQRVLDDLEDSDNSANRTLAADVAQLSRRLQDELESFKPAG
jgi:hypothetical protein